MSELTAGEEAYLPCESVGRRATVRGILESATAKVIKSGTEVGGYVGGDEGFLRDRAIAEGEFRSMSADPSSKFCGLERGFSLGEEGGGDAGEDIAHPAGSHAGVAGRVVGTVGSALTYEGARAFEQERYRILADKGFEPLAAGAEILWKEALHLERVRREKARGGGVF